jgi:hypothetical protein
MQVVGTWLHSNAALVIFRNWRMSLALPMINVIFVITFWQSQLIHYTQSTKGVLYMWLVSGLIFLLLQISLLAGSWHKARHELVGDHRIETCWNLAAQIALLLVAAIYNGIALVEITALNVRPTTYFDAAIVAILLITLTAGCIIYRGRNASPAARLLYATGSKAAPQWLQAVSLAVFGSAGLHIATMGAIIAMGGTRFLLAKDALQHFSNNTTTASYKAALRDFLSILAMAGGWIAGRL